MITEGDLRSNPRRGRPFRALRGETRAERAVGLVVGVDEMWGLGLVGFMIGGSLVGGLPGAGQAAVSCMELTGWIAEGALVAGAILYWHSRCDLNLQSSTNTPSSLISDELPGDAV